MSTHDASSADGSQDVSLDLVLRPLGSALLGGSVAVIFLIGAVMAWGEGVTFVAVLVTAAMALVVLLVRPFVRLTLGGITIHNPFRRTVVPWTAYEDVSAQWNLVVYAGPLAVKAWAIAAKVRRRGGSGVLAAFSSGALKERLADPGPPAPVHRPGSLPTTAGPAAVLVENLHVEWQELVRDGLLDPDPLAPVTRRWDPLDIALVGVPLVVALVSRLG
jgi:hypothetical protein